LSKPLSGTLSISVRRDAHIEREANAFAAELLMPKIILTREAHKYTLSELARHYVVSVQAMEIRLKELGLVCKDMCGAVYFFKHN
jgi:Zn-dependent peptidase ImmA (M78 family)